MGELSDFTPSDLESGEEYLTLGPAYFAARRVCEAHLEAFQAEHMKPLIEQAAKDFTDKLWDSVRDHLWSDTEMNLQGQMWRMVDEAVRHTLAGEGWAMRKYALGERYDCEAVRKAVAAHIPEELQSARIADLEKQVALLEESLKWARR